jgi:tRNA (guanine26-N2/guanine27-N2)-dimethyltransferase
VKNTATRLGYVWQSTGCDNFYWQRVGRRVLKGNGNTVKYMPGTREALVRRVPTLAALAFNTFSVLGR